MFLPVFASFGRVARAVRGSLAALVIAMWSLCAAWASPATDAGPYRVELVAEPGVISVGKTQLRVKITSRATGQPVTNAAVRVLTKMPAMDMGEREQTARHNEETPGIYRVPAQFAMEGGYTSIIKITGPLGEATAQIPLETGQNTGALGEGAGTAGAFPLVPVLGVPVQGGVLVFAAVVLVLWRMRRTGQSIPLAGAFNASVLSGLGLLGLVVCASVYAVNHFRRPGAMTPVQAQAMDMSYLPAPPGFAPVELVSVSRGTVAKTVRYTGTAVGFVEQDVFPRVVGTLTYMPLYPGDAVQKNQIIARLDTTQTGPQAREKQAAAGTARQNIAVARAEAQQAQEDVKQAQAEVAGKDAAISEARATVSAARDDKESVQAALASAKAQVTDANAQVVAAQADQTYWQAQIVRSAALLKAGAISGEEYQSDKAKADTADAKVAQAKAGVNQANAGVRAANAALRRTDSQIAGAAAQVARTQSERAAQNASVRAAQAAVSVAQEKITAAQSGAEAAEAGAQSASAAQGYGVLRADVNGVVTQRLISPGVLVSPGQAIVRIAQISPIRLQANVAESDLTGVRVGALVQISGRDEANKPIAARVSSVAPLMDSQARTAVVEAIVPNTNKRFVPGQFVVMDINTGKQSDTLRVPVQSLRYRTPTSDALLADKSQPFVWVADASGAGDNTYTVRAVDVQTGVSNGTTVAVLSGVKEGEQVVVSGDTDLKNGDTVAAIGASPIPMAQTQNAVQKASVTVTPAGFVPAQLNLVAGKPAQITFTRKTNQTCAKEVVFADYQITKTLPMNTPVTISLTPKKGEIGFACPMNMIKGTVVAK